MADYRPTIGLEIHAELKTSTKMFCASKNDPLEERPNYNVCPVCMAYPGTLPVVNKSAVHHVLRVGAAINGEIADYTEFDRKNYFYPDIPKGYQISQYQYPLIKGGELSGVKVTRIHLEEDTANSKHKSDHSIVDFNRAGVPLMELVTEPVIHDAQTASTFAKELQLLLRTLGAGEANMEQGQMRVEANISVSRDGTLGTKTEVKNLNSFKSVERAIEFEIKRQIEVLESGGALVQETRGFNEDTGETFSQRLKESSHDYRYFPDPDIPKFKLSLVDAFDTSLLKGSLPELPWQKRARYASLGIKERDVEVLVADQKLAAFIDGELINNLSDAVSLQLGINYLISDVRGMSSSEPNLGNLASGKFVNLVKMVSGNELSSRGAKDVLLQMLETGGDPKEIASKLGIVQDSSEESIQAIVDQVIAANVQIVAQYKAGKAELLQFLIGQGMKMSKGAANPAILARLLKGTLDKA